MNSTSKLSNWEKIAGFAFGVVFLATLLALTVFIPEPSPSQYATFKTILAIAAAGIGGILAGFIEVKGSIQKVSVRAGGALALFVIVFFFTPPPPEAPQDPSSVQQTIEPGGTGVIHTGSGDIKLGTKNAKEHETKK